MEKSGAACTDLMVAGQAVPFSIGFFSHLLLIGGCYEMADVFPVVCYFCTRRRCPAARQCAHAFGSNATATAFRAFTERRACTTTAATLVSAPVWIMPTPIIPIDVSQTDIVESAPDRETPEKEQSEQSVLHDRNSHPDRAGLDFSSGEVVADADEEGDVYFVVDEDGPQFVVKDDTDIQEIGEGEEPLESVSYSSTDWSPAHRVPIQANARYVIWTWDNQYFAFRVVLLAGHRVALEWKRLSGGAKLAANIAYRTGTHHREQPPKFGR